MSTVLPHTPEWRTRVRSWLASQGRGAHARLARGIGCSSGTLAELLGEDERSAARYSRFVEKIDHLMRTGAPEKEVKLATTEDWRLKMTAARKAKGLSQKQLGAHVGAAQAMISLIESGEVSSSEYVLPISSYLGLGPPQHHDSEDARRWSELGHQLRSQRPDRFARLLALVEAMVEE